MGQWILRCFLVAACGLGHAAADVAWDMSVLGKAPAFREAPGLKQPGVKAVVYEGVPWRGKATRVFAYYGLPESDEGGKVPGMVLVHGGGGSAFADWVRLWNSRGYAAIAMDTCGSVSGGGYRNHERHEEGGPPGWGGFDQLDLAATDQWSYHAVAAVIRGHSLLRSFAEVDAERTGITGISWGGYLTSIVAPVDGRFRFAAPVYGCGFITENSTWLPQFARMGERQAELWRKRFDPSSYLARLKAPVLWISGTNDFAYPLDSLQKSYRLPQGPRWISIPGDMPHGQPQGQEPAVLHAFADQILKGGKPLPVIRSHAFKDGVFTVGYESALPVSRAELWFTADEGSWKERKWKAVEAGLDGSAKVASAQVPAEARVAFLNLHDPRGCVVSSEHIEIEK